MATPPDVGVKEATSALQSSIRELRIGEKGPIQNVSRPVIPASSARPIPKKKAPVVADSWEDEVDTMSEEENLGKSPQATALDTVQLSPLVAAEGPLDPPPTPISPQTSRTWSSPPGYSTLGPNSRDSSNSRSPAPSRRPEKQTAVAGRMIAGALGLRAPKRTEEQRAYDRAIKEQEIKRRNREREEAAKAEEEDERARAAVWND